MAGGSRRRARCVAGRRSGGIAARDPRTAAHRGRRTPDARLQIEIRSHGRLVAVVDAWFDDAAVAVEFDGRIKYADPWRGRSPEQVLWEEKRREDELRALDIRVVRVGEADLGGRWVGTERRLRELVASPGPAARRFTATPRLLGRQRAG